MIDASVVLSVVPKAQVGTRHALAQIYFPGNTAEFVVESATLE